MLVRILFVFTVLFAGGAAADGDQLRKAREAYNLAVSDKMVGDMGITVGENVVSGINQQLQAKGKSLTADQAQKIIDRFTVEFFALMKEMEGDIIQIYANNLNERELDLLIKIYSDPEMAAIMGKLPTVMGEMMPLIQQRTPKMAQRIIGDLRRDGVLADL
ncbi:MAG: DUF2059 domain-containing protein [Pikeienuella sp.]